MRIQNSIILMLSAMFLSSCAQPKGHSIQEKNKMEICHNAWLYEDIINSIELKVLLYDAKSNYDLSSFPNFIIGTTSNLDTIGIIDLYFNERLNVGDNIIAQPTQITEDEKLRSKPLFILHKNPQTNNLYCSVKKVYYGQIIRK